MDAAEACTADTRCQRLRTEYVAQCLGRAAPGGCPRARCRRALRRFFARGSPALTHALLFCPCADPVCAERRRQTFVPACAFSGLEPAPPSCLAPLAACESSAVCRCRGAGRGRGGGAGGRGLPLADRLPAAPHRPRLLDFQASCAPAPGAPAGCPRDQASRCRRAYAGLVGTQCGVRVRAEFSRASSTWVGRLLSSRGPRRHRSHPELRGQRERARGALVRLRSQRKSAGGVRRLQGALHPEPLPG